MSRVCPECGADRWKMREVNNYIDGNRRLQDRNSKLAAKNGILSHKMEVLEQEHKEHMASVQRKVQRQARVIVRLEKRLKELGNKPYEGAKFEETSTGAEYDAA